MFSRESLVKVRDFGRDRNLLCSPTTHLDGSWEAALSPGDATLDSFSSVGGFVVFTGILWQLAIRLGRTPVPSKYQKLYIKINFIPNHVDGGY